MAYSPDGRWVASGGEDNTVRVWNARAGGDSVRTLRGHASVVSRVAFGPDGQHLASYDFCRAGSSIVVWDLESRQIVRHCGRYFKSGGEEWGGPICFSPDGRHLATGDDAGRIRILDWAGDRDEVDIPAHNQIVTALAYSPDGRLLASGGGFSREDVRLWNPATGQPAGSLAGHHAWISVLQFSGDGRQLLSASADQTIAVWDVSARRLIRRLRGHLDEVHSLVVDERRANLISGARDGTLARWEIDKLGEHALRFDLPGEYRQPAYGGRGSEIAVLDQHGAVALWSPAESQVLSVIAALGTKAKKIKLEREPVKEKPLPPKEQPLRPGDPVNMVAFSGPGQVWPGEEGTTTCVVIDKQGNAVAATTSSNGTYGICPSLGFPHNTRMSTFNTQKGHPNALRNRLRAGAHVGRNWAGVRRHPRTHPAN